MDLLRDKHEVGDACQQFFVELLSEGLALVNAWNPLPIGSLAQVNREASGGRLPQRVRAADRAFIFFIFHNKIEQLMAPEAHLVVTHRI